MPSAQTSGGIGVAWGAEHRDGQGNLISRQASVEVPSTSCANPICLLRFIVDAITYALVLTYHKRRTTYAEANRHKKILERYRTGEPSPRTLWGAIHANIKLTCPICRKYNNDLFKGG